MATTQTRNDPMKPSILIQEVKRATTATLFLVVVLCAAYPLVVWGVAQVAFPHQANGSLVRHHGQVVGSGLIGQNFYGAHYFHPRPSTAGSGYDAAGSGGSNLGPLSQKLVDDVTERLSAYRLENHLAPDVLVPADAVTASGSGLDPHISPHNAELQASRVAGARNLPVEDVRRLIEQFKDGPSLAFFGEPGVNVLTLNMALDRFPGENQ
jgi:potassium-transporting ATPase KdpC subunit